MLFLVYVVMIFSNQNSLIIDFGKGKDGENSQIVNDDVMGGKPDSKLIYTNSSIIFKGSISLENNGGFASFRSSIKKWDLSKYKSKYQI